MEFCRCTSPPATDKLSNHDDHDNDHDDDHDDDNCDEHHYDGDDDNHDDHDDDQSEDCSVTGCGSSITPFPLFITNTDLQLAAAITRQEHNWIFTI